MLKAILFAVLASAFAQVSDDKHKLLYSFHAPQTLPSIGLTTGELKKFSGHAMNIIRSKCPAVSPQKIFNVQKYIGKLIAKEEPVQGNSKVFQGLLETMTSCSKKNVIPTTRPSEDDSSQQPPRGFFNNMFSPFRQIRTFWIHRTNPASEPTAETETNPMADHDETNPTIDHGIDSGLVQPEVRPLESADPSGTEVPTRRIIKTTIIMRPSEMQEGIQSSGGIFNWIHSIFSRMGGFFGNMFPFGGMSRKKRDLSELGPISDRDSSEEAFPAFNSMPPMPQYQVFVPAKDDSNGKKAFGKLIDEMCRLYCSTCTTGHSEIMHFKESAKELLEFLFKEESGIELAAKKYIDDDFLTSIHECH